MNSTATFVGHANNRLELTADGIWVLADGRTIPYSDGAASEAYLRQVFGSVRDLSCDSSELERWIKDWPSEYHLSRKRGQLLKGFKFDRSASVLEVGCGCGAITRFLGESFDRVTAVEGGLARAKLARLRTRDLPGVSVVCAPFQDLQFDGEFDIVYCIGVLEYAGSFVQAADPYQAFLARMSQALKPGGRLVLAIENQFGLKYFSSSREDHTNVMFEGVEDYPRYGSKVRTFGYWELTERLAQYFPRREFFFPYPDYKVPDVVVGEDFLHLPNASLVATHAPSRDYGLPIRPLFDERSAAAGLGRNRQLPFFANSFLVYAAKDPADAAPFAGLGRMYSCQRPDFLAAITRFEALADGAVVVAKERAFPAAAVPATAPVRIVESTVQWERGRSLHAVLRAALARSNGPRTAAYDPCRPWVAELKSNVIAGSPALLPGKYLDAIFQNAFIDEQGCRFVDLEWEWHEPLPLAVIVIRAFYVFFVELSASGAGRRIGRSSVRTAIREAAAELGIRLSDEHFRRFLDVESSLYACVSLHGSRWARLRIGMFLNNRRTEPLVREARRFIQLVQLHGARGVRALRRTARV